MSFSAGAVDTASHPAVPTAIYRIAQEAVTNAQRHARARRIQVSLTRTAGGLLLEIADDGVGMDVEARRSAALAGASSGLLNMEERARLAGGTCTLVSTPGSGTTLRVAFTLDADAAGA